MTPALSYDWREREKKGEIINGMGVKRLKPRSTVLLTMPLTLTAVMRMPAIAALRV